MSQKNISLLDKSYKIVLKYYSLNFGPQHNLLLSYFSKKASVKSIDGQKCLFTTLAVTQAEAPFYSNSTFYTGAAVGFVLGAAGLGLGYLAYCYVYPAVIIPLAGVVCSACGGHVSTTPLNTPAVRASVADSISYKFFEVMASPAVQDSIAFASRSSATRPSNSAFGGVSSSVSSPAVQESVVNLISSPAVGSMAQSCSSSPETTSSCATTGVDVATAVVNTMSSMESITLVALISIAAGVLGLVGAQFL